MTKPKLTTWGFLKSLAKHAITGEGDNPMVEVMQEGLKANGKEKVIEATAEEQEGSQKDYEHEAARKGSKAPKTP